MNKKYQLFKFTEVFKYERGKRFTKPEQIPGDIAYISSTKLNNGIDNYVTPPDKNLKGSKIKIFNNCLTLSNSGSVGLLFYHDYDFVASDHVTVIWIKDTNVKLNKYIALYLKPVFEAIKYKYNFGREISNPNLENEYIKLPIDYLGNPDWQYMENYIKSLEKKISFSRIKTSNIKKEPFKIDSWIEYKFTDNNLWSKIVHGQRHIEADRTPGDVNYYSASEYNNSLTDKISNPLYIESHGIVYNTFGSAFFVEGEFTASDEIYSFHNENLNKYNALFITTIINQNKYKFKFGRKAFKNKFENETIKLPSIKKNDGTFEPNWQYMENYIKSLPYGDLI